MPQRERMCTLAGLTKTSNILKALRAITQFHLRKIINQKSIMLKASHTHTYQQAINLHKRIIGNSWFCVSFLHMHLEAAQSPYS